MEGLGLRAQVPREGMGTRVPHGPRGLADLWGLKAQSGSELVTPLSPSPSAPIQASGPSLGPQKRQKPRWQLKTAR